ncbi:MAG: LysM peptidoglycan-binding domain-containing protein [Planctomycetaceae bacterium]
MSWGTKIGLLLVVILCGIGGFFVYQNIRNNAEIVDAPPAEGESEEFDEGLLENDGRDGERRHHRHAKSDENEIDPAVELTGAVTDAPPPQRQKGFRGNGGKGKFDFDEELIKDASAPQGQQEPESDPFAELGPRPRGHHHAHDKMKPANVSLGEEEEVSDSAAAETDAAKTNDDTFDEIKPGPRRGGHDPFGEARDRGGYRGGPFGRKSDPINENGDPFADAPAPLPGGRRFKDSQDQAGTTLDSKSAADDKLLNGAPPAGQTGNRRNPNGWNNNWDRDAANLTNDDDAPEELDEDLLDAAPSHTHSASHSPTSSPGDAPAPQPGGGRRHGHEDHGLMKDMQVYVVEQNDSFWSIAKKTYGAGSYFNALAAFNQERIPDPQKMRPGMKVFVPPKQVLEQTFPQLIATLPASSAQSVHQSGFATTVHGRHGDHDHHHGRHVQPAGFFVSPQGQPSYRIGKEDTLSEIAKTHLGRASRWSQIYELNRQVLQTPHSLQVGVVLQLPADASSVALVKEGSATR